MSIEMIIKEVEVKSIITKSNLPETDYVINPYVGCQHACIYCYAEFMKKYTGHKENWGEFVDIKINALDTMKNLEKLRDKKILLSSVTDAYHPVEAKYKLTRQILEKLIPFQPKIEILTKSRLVTRDIDILRKFNDATVGVSIATMDKKISRELEPLGADPHLRLETIKKCKESGLKTYVFVSPIFPYLTNISEIIEKSSDIADFMMFENLNIRINNKAKILNFIKEHKPELLGKYENLYEDKTLLINMEQKIKKECENKKIPYKIFFHHGGFK